MIRGVDREIREAIKDAAKTEGVSVGTWVRRSLVRALEPTADGPTTVIELSKHMQILNARLSVLEKSYRALHQKAHVADKPAAKSASEIPKRWRHTRKSN
jgi:hypothetical protein